MASINELLKCTLVYTSPNSSIGNNVFYFSVQTATIDDDDVVDDLADWATLNWGPLWADVAAANAELDHISVDVILADHTVARNLGLRAINLAGDAAGGNPASAVSAYLLAQTVHPKQRGSKYVPFVAEASMENGLLTSTALTDLALLLLQYLATQTITGGTQLVPGIVSRTLAAFVPFEPQGLVNDVPAYQRRRKPFVGS